MKIADILNDIDNEALALPVFQRGYVWKRRQVRDFMASLYNGYPVGSLLTWTTRAENAEVRNDDASRISGPIDLLLDGQQRVTSLYGIMKGKPPPFFDGDSRAFTDLHFNLEKEEFEFYAPVKMGNDPLWISVSGLFTSNDDQQWMSQLPDAPEYNTNLRAYMRKAQRIEDIQNVDLHVSRITGDDKTAEIVVDIFNRVNSGGTKLSKGDLALARIGAGWPSVREEMQQRLDKWKAAGFDANLDWLLRCMNAIVTGASEFERMGPEFERMETIRRAFQQAEFAVDHLLEAMRSHLHMDINRVYSSKQAFPVMVKYLVDRDGRFPDQATMARLLHWYISVAIWGRFSGPVETTINQDLAALGERDPIEALLRNLRFGQGERTITHENFDLNYTTARFYPLLYIMSRIRDSRDWGTGNQLRHHSLGDHSNLELHHIFPKAYLRRHGISSKDANNMGNLAFQTRETNRAIGSKAPSEYMPEVATNWPGALASQWIPTDPELWHIENYHRFLDTRRRLLADTAIQMLAALHSGLIPPVESPVNGLQPQVATASAVPPGDCVDDEEQILASAEEFAVENGLPAGERAYEIFDEETGEPGATLDLAWPEGLQVGYSQPVALMIDEDDLVRRVASDAGFRVFTTLPGFRRYVERNILAEAV